MGVWATPGCSLGGGFSTPRGIRLLACLSAALRGHYSSARARIMCEPKLGGQPQRQHRRRRLSRAWGPRRGTGSRAQRGGHLPCFLKEGLGGKSGLALGANVLCSSALGNSGLVSPGLCGRCWLKQPRGGPSLAVLSDRRQCADPGQSGRPRRVPLRKHLELDQDHSFVSRSIGVRYAVGTFSKSPSSQAPAAQP